MKASTIAKAVLNMIVILGALGAATACGGIGDGVGLGDAPPAGGYGGNSGGGGNGGSGSETLGCGGEAPVAPAPPVPQLGCPVRH